MSIVAADLIAYCCLLRVTDDVTTAGGDIAQPSATLLADRGVRPAFTQLTANALTSLQSTAAGDTGTATVNGRASTGATNSEAIVMTGVTEKTGAVTFERWLDLTLSAVAVGTITVRQGTGGATRYTIPIAEVGFSALFRRSASATGGATIRYDKIFWQNTNNGISLTAAAVSLTADPDARIRIGLAAAVNDTVTIANRVTAPASISFVDDNVSQSVPGGSLAGATVNGGRIGVWIEENLPANDPPHRTTFTTQLTGTTV